MHQQDSSAPVLDLTFPQDWQATVLQHRPLISPARHYVYPREVEEVERGALELLIRPTANDPEFLATFALGFADPAVPTGVWACPMALRRRRRLRLPDRHRQSTTVETGRVSPRTIRDPASVTAVVTIFRAPIAPGIRSQWKGLGDKPPLLGRHQDSRGPRSQPHRPGMGPHDRSRI
jgi:hypothetical protein